MKFVTGFRYLVQNCRNKREKEGKTVPQNKFKVLSSRVIQSGEGERIIKRMEVVVVECFKCGEKGHKCRECPLWRRKKQVGKRVACVAKPQKVHQQDQCTL